MQKFTIRPLILPHKANKKGITSIRIAVTVDRNVTYIATSHRIHTNQWDDANKAVFKHENAKLINVSVKRKMAEIEAELIKNSIQGIPISKTVIKGKAAATRLFKDYAAEVKYHHTKIARVTKFGGENLMLSEITVEWLRKFEAFWRDQGHAQNTINTTFKYVGRILNQAKVEKLITDDPFENYKKPKFKQTDRVYLVDAELKKLISYLDKPIDESLMVTLKYFLLACYTGIRHSDWAKFEYDKWVEDNFLKLRATKNNVHVVMPIGKTLNKILKAVDGQPKPFSNQKCNEKLKAIAAIAGIKKNISTHTGRHSFGYLCAANGLPESTTAALLGVSAQTVKVYYHLAGENIKMQAEILKHI
jgi:integrase